MKKGGGGSGVKLLSVLDIDIIKRSHGRTELLKQEKKNKASRKANSMYDKSTI